MSNVEDIYPLSPAQHGMLFYTLSAPESGVYFEQFPLAYEEGLDPDVFAAAWQQVVDRNPILRTSFLWEGLESPVQVVHRKVHVPLERHDWRSRPAEEQQRDIAVHAEEDRRRGFDLTRPPLLRLALFRFGETSYRVIWSHHHLLLDGWSVGLMMNDVFAAYKTISLGQGAQPPARPPFKAFINWLRQRDTASSEAYWRQVLAGFRRPTPLMAPPVSEVGLDPGYELRLIRISPDLTGRLRAFAQRNRVTVVTLIYGAWALYLARTGGERDVAFGTTMSGRSPSLPGVDSIMGCLINTLPVRVQADPGAELAPWLQALQKSLVELRQHEHTPLVDVLGWADLPRRVPLFDSLVIFESFTADASFVMSHTRFFQRSHYGLTLVSSLDPVVTLRLGYEPGRFSEDLVFRILRDLEALLAAMVEDPAQPLGALVGELAAEPLAEAEPREPGPRIPPRTDREKAIAGIWREVLGLEEVGVEDDFFDLGGHSLLLLRMADKVRAAAGKELPSADLLACRTVASLAQAVEASLVVDVL